MHLLQPIKVQFMLLLFRMFDMFDNKAKYVPRRNEMLLGNSGGWFF